MDRSPYFQALGWSITTSISEVASRLGVCVEPTPTLPVVAILRDDEPATGLPPGSRVFRLPSQASLVESLLAGGSPEPDDVVAAPESVPDSITATQIRLWLFRRGISPAGVAAAIAGIADESARGEAMIQWDYAPYIERSHPLVEAIAATLGMSPAEVDAAFVEASRL